MFLLTYEYQTRLIDVERQRPFRTHASAFFAIFFRGGKGEGTFKGMSGIRDGTFKGRGLRELREGCRRELSL